ncbi:hypothetical protein FEM48_Zijuj01G0262800 [Ziziphus jujuba var. spinosa]|uniref:ATPase AAA-type core domain-containing protein n=1 Tax=Ziziphus jujuba var. spinosa TaxID=714518 RepID=A0A978W4Y8_ZIZJJ|nr:hypothetical protein FEM48_Zijuj01G0262800 [Ziziphus jujuba var. spinosa]
MIVYVVSLVYYLVDNENPINSDVTRSDDCEYDVLLPQSKAVTDYKLHKSLQQQLAVDLLQRACFELINNIDTDDDLDEYLFTRTHIELNEISKEKYPGKRVWSTYVKKEHKELKEKWTKFETKWKPLIDSWRRSETGSKHVIMLEQVVRSLTGIPISWLLPVTKPKLFPRTKLAKAIAEQVFDDKDMLTEFDMSKYNGSEFREQLTGVVKKRPFRVGVIAFENRYTYTKVRYSGDEQALEIMLYTIFFLDGIEEANGSNLKALISLLDHGMMIDDHGHKVTLSNNIFMLASNAGNKRFIDFLHEVQKRFT